MKHHPAPSRNDKGTSLATVTFGFCGVLMLVAFVVCYATGVFHDEVSGQQDTEAVLLFLLPPAITLSTAVAFHSR